MRREAVILAVAVLSALLIGFVTGRRTARTRPGEPVAPRVDTLVVWDTLRVVEAKTETIKVVDSVLVPVTDTIRMRDTLYVFLERRQVRWEDTLSVVYASGIDPRVDSVIHYTREVVVAKEIPVVEVRKTRWGIGFQAGATADRDGVIPYVGVGISYDLLSW